MPKSFKNILFYYRGLPNKDMPMEGTSRSLLNWAEYVASEGISGNVDVCGDYIKKKQTHNNINYLKIPKKGYEDAFLEKYDVVFFFTFRGVFANCRKKKKQVWVLEQQCFEVSLMEQGKTDDFDFCIAHSNAQKYQMIRQGVKTEDIFVVPNICDFDGSYAASIHKRDENAIMFVGAIVPHKGLGILIDALPEIRKKRPKVSLHVYGSSGMWKADGNEYENAIRSKKVKNVFYHGAVPSDVIIREYEKYSIMCLPTALECFPHVSIEAQNSGCIPVIHDAGGSYATMAINKTGFVYRPNTPKFVAETIDKAFQVIAKNPNMRKVAKDFALANFSQESVGKKMNTFFSHLKSKKKFFSESGFDFAGYIKSASLSEDMLYTVVKKELKKITIICGMRNKNLRKRNHLSVYDAYSLAKRLYGAKAYRISVLWLEKILGLKSIDKDLKMDSYFILADINKANKRKYNRLNKNAISVLKNVNNKTDSEIYKVASLYKEKELYCDAVVWFKKVLKNNPVRHIKGGVYFHLAEINFLQNKYSKASKLLKQCLKYIPNHGKALNYLEKIS